ncbi:MAG: short-chain dehydrogenase/reductase SDR [Bacteroidetes bacterium]|nr:MAG: short-chain dehydrogenase/reductase SDR [Bacteroidota bacterium]
MNAFKNKVVWITGASSGIGEALVYAFAKEGAKIVLSARRSDELERVKKASGLSDADAFILPLDLSKIENADALAQQVIARFGRIDVLVNNGGISQRAHAQDTSIETDRRIMEVNFFSAVLLTKSVLPHMLKQKSGHIVAMSSIAGKFGFYLRSAYSASKHALHGFYESLRLEVEESGIRVLIACPGKIQTNISVHALTGNGHAHNQMDQGQAEGMPADVCAKQIIEAMLANKEEALIGGRELKAVWLKRIFPGIFARVIRKQKRE